MKLRVHFLSENTCRNRIRDVGCGLLLLTEQDTELLQLNVEPNERIVLLSLFGTEQFQK